MVENEESLSDQNRNISSLEYRTKFLEQENGMLQDRISSLSRQRMALEKVVREYRMEKQKEVRILGCFCLIFLSLLNTHEIKFS